MAHVTTSVGWLGAVIAYLGLAVTALTTRDAQTVPAMWIAMEVTGWYVIVPLALASIFIGVINALGTSWGLFRHYWVVVKLALTLFATTILLLHLPAVSTAASMVAESPAEPGALRSELLHAAGGLLVLLVTTTLSVYKPQGLTSYGWRRQREQVNTRRGPPEL